MSTTRVLFVCLGNICRSPLAEAAFRRAASEAGLDVHVDSAGTANYHVGEMPDPRSIDEAGRHGIDITGYRGRQLVVQDFHEFDYIFGMDRSNMTNISRIQPEDGKAQVRMLLDIVRGSEGRELSDPWYGGEDNFRATWEDVTMAAEALVAILRDGHS
ncbi:low molecular weight protein-tyrosine-phosphatase [Qipengyuania vesicularis]|uniref:low molecular weight protein-tyrosine-phosphatase n=1 Tax=Qipengyuania vesicularis TaxID=2867232 RepID=UPI001C871F40|nr:low molecular weight protein-tyrosine-phosphatase [Qipengyuania vesicularis]MBX7527173.1 low molecular weight phosphotyrosine protein phosphatase [Qipengyuania vesicularis]